MTLHLLLLLLRPLRLLTSFSTDTTVVVKATMSTPEIEATLWRTGDDVNLSRLETLT